jgi:hypothetical protein
VRRKHTWKEPPAWEEIKDKRHHDVLKCLALAPIAVVGTLVGLAICLTVIGIPLGIAAVFWSCAPIGHVINQRVQSRAIHDHRHHIKKAKVEWEDWSTEL